VEPDDRPEPGRAGPRDRSGRSLVIPFATVAVVAAVVVGTVAFLRRDRGPDEVWTPVTGYETLAPGVAAAPEVAWTSELTPEGGLTLDLELSRRGAWVLTQEQQHVALSSIDLTTGDAAWESDVVGPTSIAFELELFGDDDALALSFEPAAGQTHIDLYRPDDGSIFWSDDSDDSLFTVTEGTRQPPLDGLVVFSVGPESVAVDLGTGDERWRAPLYPLVREGRLLASTQSASENRIAEVDPETGDLRWQTPVQIPLVANGVLYLIDDDNIAAVELGTGQQIWTGTHAGIIAPAMDDSIVMVRSSEVVAVDDAGRQLWHHSLDLRRLAVPTANPVIIDGERLLVVPTADRMFLLRSKDGSEVGWVSLPENSSVLAFAENTVYVGADNEVVAFSLPDLDELWSIEMDEPVTQLVPVDEGLLVAGRDTLSLLATAGS
jgi:outer membrane protein assembly factor BamB